MGLFLLRRVGVMLLTALCLTFIVYFMTTLYQPVFKGYGQWLGVLPGHTFTDEDGTVTGRCITPGMDAADAPTYCGVLQGDWGQSVTFKDDAGGIIWKRLGLTGWLALAAFAVMIPVALIIGILAGMREGSRMDRSLSTFAIASSATPEYVSGVIFIAIFAASAYITWANFTLPVATIALYGVGYIARMTRASMAEVMTAQYIRTARLKGVSGFGWLLVQAASTNDIQLLLGCSVVAVFVVLVTQLISDIGYVFLNPRIRIS